MTSHTLIVLLLSIATVLGLGATAATVALFRATRGKGEAEREPPRVRITVLGVRGIR